MTANHLTQECLKELLDYDPETGVFTWRVKRKGTRKDKKAGTLDPDGYIYIMVEGKRRAAGRLAILWMTGRLPPEDCDHRDGIPSNNKWRNLREATTAQNMHNKRVNSNNKIGLKGVCQPTGRPGHYWSNIYLKGKNVHLGTFDCPAAAHFAYVVAAYQHFGEFARA